MEQSFGYNEVLANASTYFDGDSLAAQVWINKYCLRKEEEYFESDPNDMHWRLANEISRAEAGKPNAMSGQEIFGLLQDFKRIIPQGGPMTGIGNNIQLSSLSNCFVVGNTADSYGGIFKTDQEQVQLMKRRGGVGHDISHLRPDNTPTSNAAGTATGAVSFMHRYSNSTREVAQNGRRGALMLSISIKHPDAGQFISVKNDDTSVTGANISVRIDDEFMECVRDNTPYTQQWPIDSTTPSQSFEIDAVALWKEVIHNAWSRAEPGVLFWDRIIQESLPDCYRKFGFKTTSTNPCGEIPLCPYDSCRLLAINLFGYVKYAFTSRAVFDFEAFAEDARKAMRMMDSIIDLEIEKINAIIAKIISDPEFDDLKQVELDLWRKILAKCTQGRRTGVGITAMGDMLASLGFKYGTKEATEFATEVHKVLAVNVYYASAMMAKEMGPFEVYDADLEKDNPFLNRILDAAEDYENTKGLRELIALYGRRNIACLTIAPTGTTSMMSQTSSGIEPAFMMYYTRRTKVNPGDPNSRVDFIDDVGDCWMENKVFHHKFVDWYAASDDPGEELDRAIALAQLEGLDKDVLDTLVVSSPWHGATANDVDWEEKVRMQGAIQKYIDHSISVTVNIPNEATEELVDLIYRTGWEVGCKGITVYRDGCRSGVLVTEDTLAKQKGEEKFGENHAPKRGKVLEAKVIRFQNNYDTWIAFVGLLDGKPYEIFTGKTNRSMRVPSNMEGSIIKSKGAEGKGKYDFMWLDDDNVAHTVEDIHELVDMEFYNYGKLISGILRHGMPIPYIVEIIGGLHFEEDHISTWKNGILRAIKQFIPDGSKATDSKCPECDDPDGLEFKEGCLTCKSCGHSKCG
jgi:ribonucleoside-diphosphate reductase alpha chain